MHPGPDRSGRMTVEADTRNSLFPEDTQDPGYSALQSFSWHAYGKRGVSIRGDAEGVHDNVRKYAGQGEFGAPN